MTFYSMLPKQKSVTNTTSCYICYIILYRYVNMGFYTIFMNRNHFLKFYEAQLLLPLFEHFSNIMSLYMPAILIFTCTNMRDDVDLECNKNVYPLTGLT